MFARTLRQWLSRPARPARRRPRLEALEDRVVPILQYVNLGTALTFYGDFTQDTTRTTLFTANNTVVSLGWYTANDANYTALLQFDLTKQATPGVLRLDTSDATNFQFARALVQSVAQGPVPLNIWQTASTDTDLTRWDVNQLVSSNGLALSGGQPFTALGLSFTLTTLLLDNPGSSPADAQVKMQGTATFAQLQTAKLSLPGFQARVEGGNYLTAQVPTEGNLSGLSLNGLDIAYTGPSSVNLFGVTATLDTPAIGYNVDDNGKYSYTITVGGSLSTTPKDQSHPPLQNVGADLVVTMREGQLDRPERLGFDLKGSFKIFDLAVATDQGNPLRLDYNFDQDRFEGSGGLTVTVPTKTASTVDVVFSYSNQTDLPGLVVQDGRLTYLNAEVNANVNFALAGLSLTTPNGLTFVYDSSQQQFELFGDLKLNVNRAGGAPIVVDALLGNSSQPGLVIKDGELHQLNMGLSGQFDLYGFSILVSNAGVTYDRDQDRYTIGGTIVAPQLWNATVTLGTPSQPGIVIQDGTFHLDQVSIALSDVNIGVFTVQQLQVSYSQPDPNTDPTIDVKVFLVFPEGWGVGGDITFDGDKVNDITLFYTAGTGEGVEIGDTGLFLTYLEGSVRNIDDPHNLIVSGNIAFTYGPTITIFDPFQKGDVSVTLFAAAGGFTVDRHHLQLDGNLYVGAYSSGTDENGKPQYHSVLGADDSASVDLDWGAKQYTATTSLSLYAGVIEVDGAFAFDETGDIVMAAKAELEVPHEVPIIGGKKIGSVDFLFEYHEHDLDNSFFAAWTEFEIPVIKKDVKIGVKYDVRHSHLSILSGKEIDAFDGCFNHPEQCLDENGQYLYYSSYAAPTDTNGLPFATAATLSVSWPIAFPNQYVAVTLPGGSPIPQDQFDQVTGPVRIALVNGLSSPTQSVVHVTSTDPDVPLPAGTYTLTFYSPLSYDQSQVTFGSAFHFPEPTVNPPALGPVPTDGTSQVDVTLSGTVDQGFTDSTHVSLYVDTTNDPTKRGGIPVKGATALPITTDALGNWSLQTTWDLSGLTPSATYYLYALINDGTNAQVLSDYTAGVKVVPPLSGRVTDVAPEHGNRPVAGIQAFLDLNHNGVYDPPAATPPPLINAGGGSAGPFGADAYSTGGQTDETEHSVGIPTKIIDPAPEAVYQSNRYGYDFRYVIPGLFANTAYQVRLHFAETYWDDPGDRVFNVAINDQAVLSQFDIFAEAAAANDGQHGKFRAVVRTFLPTTGADGALTIHFTTETDFAQVNGIEVLTENGGLLLAINAGSTGAVGAYQADAYYHDDSQAAQTTHDVGIADLIPNPAPEAVYQSRRYAQDFSYVVPGLAANAAYQVRLHFAETELASPGDRVFSVAINGRTVLDHFDIFAQAAQSNDGKDGKFLAVVRTFVATTDANGALEIRFKGESYDAQVNGIEVIDYLVGPNGEPISITHTDGYYSFWDVAPNAPYDVGVVIPAAFQLATADPLNTNPRQGVVYDGAHPVTADFGLIELPAISGTVFNDVNRDGTIDPGDAGLGQWAVYLDANANGQLDDGETFAITAADGTYAFHGVKPGTHTVRVVIPPGYYQTSPLPALYWTATVAPTLEDPYPLVENANFGALKFSTISGNVSGHRLIDGYLDGMLTPLSGWVVQLTGGVSIDAGGGGSGDYLADEGFSGGAPGSTTAPIDTSRVGDPAPPEVYQTYRHGRDFTYTASTLTPGATYTVRLHFADPVYDQDNQRYVHVWINGQKVLDYFDVAYVASGEVGTGGKDVAIIESFTATADDTGRITIRFTAADGYDDALVNGIEVYQLAAVATTDASGNYSFGELRGGTYTVRPSVPFAGLAINAGGRAAGAYQNDQHYFIGTANAGDGTDGRDLFDYTTDPIDTSRVADPAPQAVYQSNRYGNSFRYILTGLTPGAAYTVRLHFAEIDWDAPGQRLFNAVINGQQVLSNFDVFAAAGGKDIALARSFDVAADAGGTITLLFTKADGSSDGAMVSGIQVAAKPGIAVNAGGGAAGAYLADDAAYVVGDTQTNSTSDPIDASALGTAAAPQAVYQTSRYGADFSYVIPDLAPLAAYQIRLHFAEFVYDEPGRRVFDVYINGQEVLDQYDIFQSAGYGFEVANFEEFVVAADRDGKITIQFTASVDNAQINGIEITAGAWQVTTAASITQTVTGVTSAGNNFVYNQIGQVNGQVFDDADRDGGRDAGEAGRPGVLVYVDRNGNGRPEPDEPTAVTGPQGHYAFAQLPAGVHQVRWLDEPGRQPTTPEGGVHHADLTDPTRALTGLDFGSAVGGDLRLRIPAGGSRDWTVSRHGDRLVVIDGDTGVALSQPLGAVRSLRISGTDGSADRLTLDLTGGAFPLPGGIELQGGPGDTLRIHLGIAHDTIAVDGTQAVINGRLTVRWAAGVALGLDGGAGNDTYALATQTTTVRVGDEDGVDTLDFSRAGAGVTVDLARDRGQAQRIGQGNRLHLRGVIENVIGSAFADVIGGNAADNLIRGGAGNDVLRGEAGRDVLIGGSGADVLFGGPGEDILIGGTTAFDADGRALRAVVAAWSADRGYAERVRNLIDGSPGLNGGTVADDGAADALFGGLGRDWFLGFPGDWLPDRRRDERLGW